MGDDAWWMDGWMLGGLFSLLEVRSDEHDQRACVMIKISYVHSNISIAYTQAPLNIKTGNLSTKAGT
jgi:hypothetical protein